MESATRVVTCPFCGRSSPLGAGNCQHCSRPLRASKRLPRQRPASVEDAAVHLADSAADALDKAKGAFLKRWDNPVFWLVVIGVVVGIGLVVELTLMLTGAAVETPFVVANWDCSASLTVPPGWKEEHSIGRSGDLQAMNPKEELFVIVSSLQKGKHLESTAEEEAMAIPDVFSAESVITATDPQEVRLNGNRGLQRQIATVYKGKPVTCLHTVVETSQLMHHIAAWCPTQQFERLRSKLEAVTNTLEVVDVNRTYKLEYYIYVEKSDFKTTRGIRVVTEKPSLSVKTGKGVTQVISSSGMREALNFHQSPLPEKVTLNGHEFKVTYDTLSDSQRTWRLRDPSPGGWVNINIDAITGDYDPNAKQTAEK